MLLVFRGSQRRGEKVTLLSFTSSWNRDTALLFEWQLTLIQSHEIINHISFLFFHKELSHRRVCVANGNTQTVTMRATQTAVFHQLHLIKDNLARSQENLPCSRNL